MNNEIRLAAIALRKESLDPNSRFYNEDLKNFTDKIYKASDEEVKRIHGNLHALSGKSKSFNKMIKKQTNILEDGGMYDISGMKPINALD